MSEDFPFQFFPNQMVVCVDSSIETQAGKVYSVESTQLASVQSTACGGPVTVYLLKVNGAWQRAERFIPLVEWQKQQAEKEMVWNPILGGEMIARAIARNRKG